MKRVAVIGAGIAGMGAAWGLDRAGFEVSVFETRDEVGGNAKTHRWHTPFGEVVTGLSVLAWPSNYFRNYTCLLNELGISVQRTPRLRYLVRDGDNYWGHGLDTPLGRELAPDFDRWDRLVARIRAMNRRMSGRVGDPSLYDVPFYNPLNAISLRRLCSLFGISRRFWELVFVPVHSSSFLSVELDRVPAVIAPALDDIVSLRHGADLTTWDRSSQEVFERMGQRFKDRIHTDSGVVRVARSRETVTVHVRRGETRQFDHVVFACPALAAWESLIEPTRLEKQLFDSVRYADDSDRTFLTGVVHSDVTALPEAYRDAILSGFGNYIERWTDPSGERGYANTFVISSWLPAARGLNTPMMVSYNYKGELSRVETKISNRRAHPDLCARNLAVAAALHQIQGKRRTYYCGSYTTPGNGHDLSLLSGLVVASAIGAPYPFVDQAAKSDFDFLRRFMLR